MIRETCPEDLEPIRAFWNPLIRDTMVTFASIERTEATMRAYYEAHRAAGQGFFTALSDGVPVGFAAYSQFRPSNGYARAMEHTVILSKAAWGKGLGRALMAAAENHARAAGHLCLIGAVSGGNPAGRDFHAAIGYHLVGTMPGVGWKFGKSWDLWLMQKNLT
jgi:phosphinothricin acetyltransferase